MRYKFHPNEKNLRKLVNNLITTWDDDWAAYLGDALNDFILNLKIPPLVSDNELKCLTMPCLVIDAENDILFPGNQDIARVQDMIETIETELISNSNHTPPTTPEFRNWLAERLKRLILKT